MVSEIDIFRSANEVIKKCGNIDDSKEYANSKIKMLHERGDIEGTVVWTRIAKAIKILNGNDINANTVIQ